MNHYETVFIATPVLSDVQVKEAVSKFRGVITENGGQIISEEDWGLRKLAYPIQKRPPASITSWSSRVRATSSKSSKPSTAATNA